MKNAIAGGSRCIVVHGTGGTIAGSSPQVGANLGYTAGTVPVSVLLSDTAVPDGFNLHAEQIAQLDSKDMDFATWHALRVRSEHWLAQDDVAGLVFHAWSGHYRGNIVLPALGDSVVQTRCAYLRDAPRDLVNA